MEIRILHLYHDLLNLYGEIGNVKMLSSHFMNQGIPTAITNGTVGDEFNFADFDFVYIGSGTEKNQLVALHDLLPHKDALKEALDNGLVMLATGNSYEIFGETIREIDGTEIWGLKFFEFHTVRAKERITSDIVYQADFLEKDVVGFVNKMANVSGIRDSLFTVKFGVGSNREEKFEGIQVNNFFGTYVIGPILVKNPYFMDYLSKLIINKVDPEFVYPDVRNENQYKAFQIVLSELHSRMSK